MSHGDDVGVVEVLIASGSLCTACLVAKSGLSTPDVEIAVRVLLRARSADPAGTCDSCRSAGPAFRTTSMPGGVWTGRTSDARP